MKNRRIFAIFAMSFLFVLFLGESVKAAEKRQIVEIDGVLQCTDNTRIKKDCYVALIQRGSEYQIVKPGTKKSTIYYFDQEGKGSIYKGTQFIAITYNGNKKTYYAKNGKLVTNQIVGSKKEGYYYVDTTGVKITDKAVQYAVQFVKKNTKDSDSNQTKLSKCYNYLWKNYKYKRVYGAPDSRALNPKAQDMSKIAKEMFKSKQGNCHRYAACFAYIARVLGYDSKVVVGSVTGNHGGMTPHSWALISYNKTGKKYQWYICDPDMELNEKYVNFYMVTSHPCRVNTKWTCTLTIKNGKVKWE